MPISFDGVVEEDEFDPLSCGPMPKYCNQWPCCAQPEKARKLVKEKRYGTYFMICPLCRGSYGEPAL